MTEPDCGPSIEAPSSADKRVVVCGDETDHVCVRYGGTVHEPQRQHVVLIGPAIGDVPDAVGGDHPVPVNLVGAAVALRPSLDGEDLRIEGEVLLPLQVLDAQDDADLLVEPACCRCLLGRETR